MKAEFPSVLDRAYSQHMQSLKVIDFMTSNVISTTPDTTMYEAANEMGVNRIGSLIVTEYRTPVGIITERDLLTKVLAKGKNPKNVAVKDEMSYPLITLTCAATIREAAQAMIKYKGRLAVYDGGDLVGIVTASDLIRSLPETPETETKVDDFMTRNITTGDEKTTVTDIATLMGANRIGSVIITARGETIGIFTERDLLTTFLSKGVSLNIPVGDRASPLITAPSGTTVHAAAQTMRSRHIRRLPIRKGEALVGIVTARDLVDAYAK